MRTFIIAEAGVNHHGSLDLAMRLVDAAAAAGADAVKFQSFRADDLATRTAAKAAYQEQTSDPSESQHAMLRGLELSPSAHEALVAHARARGIAFLSTPFDDFSLDMLTRRLGVSTIKLSSGDLTNAPLLLATARAAGRVLLSTGMSTLAEVESALGVLAFGFTRPEAEEPGTEAFRRAFSSEGGQAALRERVTVLHCTSEYPAPIDEVNLRAMDALAAAFGLQVGYSDHTIGTHVCIAAVARGARVIEKHLTLDRTQPGVDQHVSAEPGELAQMVAGIRDVERALGDGIKRPAASEWKNRTAARRSLVTTRAIRAGERFEVASKRPGTGLSPFEYWRVRARAAERDYEADEIVDA
jgi:N-acetylneuraminate synthase